MTGRRSSAMEKALKLYATGKHSVDEAARRGGVARSSLYGVIAKARAAAPAKRGSK